MFRRIMLTNECFKGFEEECVSTAGGLQSSQAAAALCAEGEQCVASESLIRKPRKYHEAFTHSRFYLFMKKPILALIQILGI